MLKMGIEKTLYKEICKKLRDRAGVIAIIETIKASIYLDLQGEAHTLAMFNWNDPKWKTPTDSIKEEIQRLLANMDIYSNRHARSVRKQSILQKRGREIIVRILENALTGKLPTERELEEVADTEYLFFGEHMPIYQDLFHYFGNTKYASEYVKKQIAVGNSENEIRKEISGNLKIAADTIKHIMSELRQV